MSLGLVRSRALVGLQAPAATVEVHLAHGVPSFTFASVDTRNQIPARFLF